MKSPSYATGSDWRSRCRVDWAVTIPGELAVFKLDELERAKDWAAG